MLGAALAALRRQAAKIKISVFCMIFVTIYRLLQALSRLTGVLSALYSAKIRLGKRTIKQWNKTAGFNKPRSDRASEREELLKLQLS